MGCQSQVILENNLTFSIRTHDPDTGALTDADSAPAWRLYEDVASTPILTGTMPKLDDANTLGAYAHQVACTAANGFEAGKSYTILIDATVDSDTEACCFECRRRSRRPQPCGNRPGDIGVQRQRDDLDHQEDGWHDIYN